MRKIQYKYKTIIRHKIKTSKEEGFRAIENPHIFLTFPKNSYNIVTLTNYGGQSSQ